MESFQFRSERIEPVRVGPVLDRVEALLVKYATGYSVESVSMMPHKELAGPNELSVQRAEEDEVAKCLNYWCEQLESHLDNGGTVENFAAENVWFVPFLQKALSIQASK